MFLNIKLNANNELYELTQWIYAGVCINLYELVKQSVKGHSEK